MSKRIDVLLIGHMTVDLTPGGRMLGGTVAYAAPTYAAFGHRVGILTSAASKEPLLEQLCQYGELVVVPSERSLTYENVYSETGRQQYIRATASPIAAGDLPDEWRRAKYAHLGPLAAELDPLVLARALPEATIMLTAQGLMRRWRDDGRVVFQRWFDEEALKLIDIVVYSEEDLRQFPRLTDEFRAVCKHLVVTKGRAGGVYYHAGESLPYDSLPVTPRDLTGAGDVFAASLLASLSALDGDIAQAVRLAGRLAAYSVTRAGLDSAPRPDEIAREMKRLKEE